MLRKQIEDFVTSGRESSKRPCFGFFNEHLSEYIAWAFSRNYLILSFDENGINGILVAYPLPKAFDGDINQLLPFNDKFDEEDNKDLCILDMFASKVDGRISLVSQFMKRYKNWENQNKYFMQVGVIKKLSNRYTKLLTLKY